MEGLSITIRKVSNDEFDRQETMKRILILQSSLCEKSEVIKNMSLEELQKLFSSYLKLAGLYKLIGSYKNAENCYLDAIDVKRKLSAKGSSKVSECLASIYESLGDIYKNQGKENKALIYYLSEAKVYEKLYKLKPEDYEKILSSKYFILGKLYKSNGLYKEAEKLLIKARTLLHKRLHNYYDKEIIMKLIELHDSLGDIYLKGKDYKKAEKEYFNSFDLRQEISDYISGNAFYDKGTTFDKLGDLYKYWEKYEEAEDFYMKAIKHREAFLASNCFYCVSELAEGYNKLATLYEEQEHHKEAETYLKKARYIEREMIQNTYIL